jgi:DNA-directed RNA polymerase subunit RPC12/RpoP
MGLGGLEMKAWLQRFMSGRHGQDDLNRALPVLSLCFLTVSLFTQWPAFYVLTLIPMSSCAFRMFSRDTKKRARENLAFLQVKDQAARKLRQSETRFHQRKTHRFYKCPSCAQTLRVPKGKGRLEIRCPKCGTSFERQT